ncbi:uncharacterized protein RHOBADRAFT_44912 [Rhodotorula graminis WP1]|uniref:J domain-containing protein n=1 Tax=Rhodotorula graminis (strain WP1) TaxID=578459 RepID=A0A194S1E8_RHOGW|nr:uncharacterized protein RHOBADRAFT_44912 [Rhodotorula graminis WP1]KPV74422.1 hypothetical protein RHOBADRAFT_44912 [Rhodotorula graminis WP1]
MAAPPPSHYALLSLSPSATPEQVRAAYLRLAKDRHPDRAPPEQREAAKRAFQDLAAAYRVLSDPALRRAYDASLARPSPPPPPPPRDARPARSPHPHPHPHQHQLPSARRRPSATPDSPFPGFRVPPGGYPHPLSLSRLPEPPSHPHPHGLAPRRARSPAPSTSSAVLRESGSGIALDPLGGLDPSFQGMQEVEQLPGGGIAWRGESVTVSFSSRPTYAPHDPFPPPPPRRAPSPAQLALPHSPSHTQHRRSSSLSHLVASPALPPHRPPPRRPPSPARTPSHAPSPLALPPLPPQPTRPHQHPHQHQHLPPPQHPAARAPRRPPSPARGPQLALAGRAHAQAQLALTAHAHESPRSVAVRQRRTSAGELGRARAPESPLFG